MASNRLLTPTSASLTTAPGFADRFESPEPLEAVRRRGRGVATFTPTGYESGYAYPLIVWLHGSGSSARELPQIMRHVSLQNFLAVGPSAPAGDDGGTDRWRQTPQGIESAEASVAEAVESASEWFNVHPGRVFVAGFGAGGTMALRLGLRRPEWFAAAVSIDGPLPRGERPLSRVNEARGLPLLLSSSRQSVGYPQQRLCSDLSLLHSAGFRVAVRQYPGDDDLTTSMLADLNRWLMELVCG